MTYKEAIKRLKAINKYDSLCQESHEALDIAIKVLERHSEKPPHLIPCICGRKRFSKWWNYSLGTWSMSCPNCGRTSDHVKHRKDLNKAWNDMIQKERKENDI